MPKKHLFALVASFLLVTATLFSPTPAAASSARPATEWYANNYNGECIDDSIEFRLRTFPCNGLAFQQWIPHRWPDGSFELRNNATQRCIDDSTTNGVRIFGCNGLTYQRWYIRSVGGGMFYWQNQTTGACLTALDNHVLRGVGCGEAGNRQFWY
ncbi:hypothetical protein J2S43_001568 [Catenuloplanes nepalensis]|uniref:Ricin B lectin domain-containing protein n=1 Tax=Catenuloplanes nepalensis TaxID=587533 RepID=A0ABT9MPR8_9ACTN|nr:RICIN domain-containing protein [Catenuloplanes nepalensis]MDP9793056.1 hypothetical protein [Catenuloplanes nepalensis]